MTTLAQLQMSVQEAHMIFLKDTLPQTGVTANTALEVFSLVETVQLMCI